MDTIWQKRLKLLDETAAHFNKNNRAYDAEMERCCYSHKVNGGCAIGRKIPAELAEKFDFFATNNAVHAPRILDNLPPELQELGSDFLSMLQALHDQPDNWDDAGLNSKGRAYYNIIKSNHCEEPENQ